MKRYTESEKEFIINQYLNKEILVESILSEWGMTKRTLARIVDSANVPRRIRGQKPNTRIAELSHKFTGGTHIDKAGYRLIYLYRDDPYYDMRETKKRPYVKEHRVVMARSLGRSLDRNETIHHINGDKLDNRIENLQLRKGNHGIGQCWKCSDCGSINIISTKI